MRRSLSLKFGIGAFILALTPLAQAAGPQHPAPAKRQIPEAKIQAPWQQELDLRRWNKATFHGDMITLVHRMSAAHGAERADVALDAAELYLSHFLTDEARSTLEGTTPDLPAQSVRHAALSDATALLQGRAVAAFDQSPLARAERPDRAFWATLHAIAAADVAMLGQNVEASFGGLGQQSNAVLRGLLPLFAEVTIETGHKKHAKAALRLINELPDFHGKPIDHFLQGRAKEQEGNDASALAAYLKGAEGYDQYAARARLAVVDLALENGSKGALLAAHSTLIDGAEAWRGNRFELELLKRRAKVQRLLNHQVEGLVTLAKLMARFPHSGEAKMAAENARLALAKFYLHGAENKFPLATWVRGHRRLLPYFQFSETFPRHIEQLADAVLALGATDMATQEYMRTLDLLQSGETRVPEDVAKRQIKRVRIKLSRALLASGLAAKAQETLAMVEMTKADRANPALLILKADILEKLGDDAGFLQAASASPKVEHLRKQALVHVKAEDWENSRIALQRLWQEHPQGFSKEDASYLLIAARRTNDLETRDQIARAFPSLTGSKALIELAESLNAAPEPVLPLRKGAAAERLTQLETAFDTINRAGVSE